MTQRKKKNKKNPQKKPSIPARYWFRAGERTLAMIVRIILFWLDLNS